MPHALLVPAKKPKRQRCPLYLVAAPAGFPSPADDHKDRDLDLNEHLIRHPAATFFLRAAGNSMRDAGIMDGDLLVIDRSLEPRNGAIVIAAVNGELTVKRLRKTGNRPYLSPENPEHLPIWIDEGETLEIWGVVTHAIHRLT